MSPLPLDIISSYSLQRLLNLSFVSCVQDWSCRSTCRPGDLDVLLYAEFLGEFDWYPLL